AGGKSGFRPGRPAAAIRGRNTGRAVGKAGNSGTAKGGPFQTAGRKTAGNGSGGTAAAPPPGTDTGQNPTFAGTGSGKGKAAAGGNFAKAAGRAEAGLGNHSRPASAVGARLRTSRPTGKRLAGSAAAGRSPEEAGPDPKGDGNSPAGESGGR